MRNAILILSFTLAAVAVPHHNVFAADPVPESAFSAAQERLDFYASNAPNDERFQAMWGLDRPIEDPAVFYLGDPFPLYFMMREDIIDFALADDSDILSHAFPYGFAFSLFYDGLLIHTMIVAPNRDLDDVERRPGKGEFLYVGGHGGSHEWLRDANRHLGDRSIVILETHGIGMFAIVRHGNATEKIVPLNLIGANLMSLSKGPGEHFPFVSNAHAAPLLKDAATKFRERSEAQLKPTEN